jgi:hypothetical protein
MADEPTQKTLTYGPGSPLYDTLSTAEKSMYKSGEVSDKYLVLKYVGTNSVVNRGRDGSIQSILKPVSVQELANPDTHFVESGHTGKVWDRQTGTYQLTNPNVQQYSYIYNKDNPSMVGELFAPTVYTGTANRTTIAPNTINLQTQQYPSTSDYPSQKVISPISLNSGITNKVYSAPTVTLTPMQRAITSGTIESSSPALSTGLLNLRSAPSQSVASSQKTTFTNLTSGKLIANATPVLTEKILSAPVVQNASNSPYTKTYRNLVSSGISNSKGTSSPSPQFTPIATISPTPSTTPSYQIASFSGQGSSKKTSPASGTSPKVVNVVNMDPLRPSSSLQNILDSKSVLKGSVQYKVQSGNMGEQYTSPLSGSGVLQPTGNFTVNTGILNAENYDVIGKGWGGYAIQSKAGGQSGVIATTDIYSNDDAIVNRYDHEILHQLGLPADDMNKSSGFAAYAASTGIPKTESNYYKWLTQNLTRKQRFNRAKRVSTRPGHVPMKSRSVPPMFKATKPVPRPVKTSPKKVTVKQVKLLQPPKVQQRPLHPIASKAKIHTKVIGVRMLKGFSEAKPVIEERKLMKGIYVGSKDKKNVMNFFY